jgi:hypothetical protein
MFLVKLCLNKLRGSIEVVGHVAHMGEKRNAYRILVGKPEGKRQLGRPRHRWMILRWILEIGWFGLIWLRIGTSGGLL